MRHKLTLTLSLALSLVVLATACGEDQPALTGGGGGQETETEHGEDAGEGHEDQGTKEIGGEQATYHGTTDVSGSNHFELELDDFYFGPTVLDGAPGQELSLGLFNEGGVNHTFTIDGVLDEELPSGADGIAVDISFPDSGSQVFYCTFHRAQGMIGALSVDGSLEAGSSEGEDSSDSVYD